MVEDRKSQTMKEKTLVTSDCRRNVEGYTKENRWQLTVITGKKEETTGICGIRSAESGEKGQVKPGKLHHLIKRKIITATCPGRLQGRA